MADQPYLIPRDVLDKVFSGNSRARTSFEKFQSRFVEIDNATTINVAATQALKDASVLTLSANAELTNERVLSLGDGLAYTLGPGTFVLGLSDETARTNGYKVTFAATGDSSVSVPLTGRLASEEWVTANFSGGGGGGSGTVTSVSVVTANGVSGSVATATTTPAITLTLGAITPTSVAASGTVTGSNLSGTNTGDQTSVSGNAGTATALQTSRNFSISGGGITAVAVSFNGTAAVVLNASVDASHITLARMADVATGTVFYRKTAGTGAPEVQTLATLKTDLGLTGTNSGDQTTIVGITGTLAEFNAALTGADFATGGGTATGTNTGDQTITLTGDVTGSGTGSFAATIAADAVGNTNLANMATATFKGRVTAGTGDPEDLTGTQATTLLDVATTSLKGLLSASDKTKLDGVATGATANATDAALRDRSTHTGTQTASTISDFSTAADARIGAASINALADVVITTPSTGQVVKYNGTNWVNDTDSTGAGGSVTFTTTEVNVGSVPKKAGKFTIAGTGLTVGKPVRIDQAVGPYTGKGTRADEAEMDGLSVKASVTSTTQITAYWSCETRVKGNFKFDYLVGA